jgi:sugar/nucleoside kinase (ribokinase family)
MRHLIMSDLETWGVAIADLMPYHSELPPVSSIFIPAATGDRAVVSMNATRCQALVEHIPTDVLHDGQLETVDIVLVDGHQMMVGEAIAQAAKQQGIPVVIDGGSWKPGFDTVLPYADIAICSANFYPPDCRDLDEVIEYLQALGIPHIAITQGDRPIRYDTSGKSGLLPVPAIQPIDTLGAGDIFHGAFCHFLLNAMRPRQHGATVTLELFVAALESASAIAAQSCQSFGTRDWMRAAGKKC